MIKMLVKEFNILLKLYSGLVSFSLGLFVFDHGFVDLNISNTLFTAQGGWDLISYRVDISKPYQNLIFKTKSDQSNNHLLRKTLNSCKHIENLKENFKNLGQSYFYYTSIFFYQKKLVSSPDQSIYLRTFYEPVLATTLRLNTCYMRVKSNADSKKQCNKGICPDNFQSCHN